MHVLTIIIYNSQLGCYQVSQGIVGGVQLQYDSLIGLW